MKGETSRLVSKYNLGYYANPNSKEDIIDNIKKFTNLNENQMKLFSKNSDFLIKNVYSFDNIISDFENNIF